MRPPTCHSSAQHTQLQLAEVPVGQVEAFQFFLQVYFQPKLRPGNQLSDLTINVKNKC